MSNEEGSYEMEVEPMMESDPGMMPQAEPERSQGDSRSWWIVAGVAAAALAVLTCCLLIVAAYFVGRSTGGDSQPVAPPAPTYMPESTPTAVPPPEATATATEAPQPTETIGQAPEPVINYPAEAQVGQEVTFDGRQSRPGTSPIASYDWDFGDGSRGRGAVVTHIYGSPGSYGVTLTVGGEDGLINTGGPVQVNIRPADTPEPTPEPEPTPIPPVIDAFSVTPEAIAVGECVTVSWSAGGATSWVNIVRDGDFIWEDAPLNGSLEDCPTEAGTHEYRIVAYNPEDDRVRERREVTVTE